jgi:branched-chain amino acid transport system substrate-binding protein
MFLKRMIVISLSMMLVLVIFVGTSLAQEKEIRMGVVLGFSGWLAEDGPPQLKAMEMAVDEINTSGGLFGQKIKLYVEDSKSELEEGIKATKKLIQINKVIGILGPWSDLVIGIMDFCADNKVPLISGIPGSSRLDKIGGKYEYRTCPSDSYEGVVDADFAYNELGLKNVSMITADDEGTMSISRGFKEAYEKLGGKILKDVIISPGQATYMSSVELAIEPKPEGIMLSASLDISVTVVKECVRAGYKGRIIGGSDIDAGKFVDLVGKENVVGLSYTEIASDPNTVPFKAFVMKWKARTNVDPMWYGVPNSYDAMVLYGLAIQAAGKATGEGIAENMHKVANPPGVKVYNFAEGKEQLLLGNDIDYEGASGPCDFNEYGNVAGGFSRYIIDSNGNGVLAKYYPPGSIK